jgi:adenine phosphoribosyltransferase
MSFITELLRDIPDFPKPGVTFKDITPLLAHGPAFGKAIDQLAWHVADQKITRVLGIEARGFIVGAPVAYRLGAGFAPVRKSGKLPWAVAGQEYELEYGTDRLEMHRDAVHPGERVMVIDDVLATGGTAEAVVQLARNLGAEVVGLGVLIELDGLGGRQRLAGTDVFALETIGVGAAA